MRTQLGIFCSAVMLALSAHAGIIYGPSANPGDIPAGGDLYAYMSEGGDPVAGVENVALGIIAGVFLVAVLARSRPVRHWAHSRRVAVVHWIDAV